MAEFTGRLEGTSPIKLYNIDKKLDLKTGGVLIYPVLEVSGPLEGTFSHLGKVTTGLFTHGLIAPSYLQLT